MKILVLDLSSAYEPLYRKKFAFLRYDLDFVKDVEAALRKIQKKSYDLVLIGHYLKNSSGMEALKLIRKLGYDGNVIITAPGNHILEIKQNYSDVCEVVNKGTNSLDFIEIIKKYEPLQEKV